MRQNEIVVFVCVCIISTLLLFLFIELCGGMSEERWVRI